MTCEEIVTQSVSVYEQLEKTQQELQSVSGKLNATKGDLAGTEEQKELAIHGLDKHMQQIGVDMERLKQVEDLALTLKEGDVSNEDLQNYIQRQQVLNKSGIGIDTLTLILEKAKVLTSQDDGKELLQMLSEYSNLSEASKAMQAKVQALGKEADGLEQQAKLKGKIEGDITKLKAEKVSLEAYVAQLYEQKDLLEKLKKEANSLIHKKAGLVQEIADLETYKESLGNEIKSLEKTTGALEELKTEYDAVSAKLSEIDDRLIREERRLQVYDSFLGVVQSSSVVQLEKFAKDLPYFIKDVKEGKHSPELIRTMLLNNLTESTLQVLKCGSCGVKFVVDKQSSIIDNYYCPLCGTTYAVKVDKDFLAILKEELLELKKPKIIFATQISPDPQVQNNNKDNGGK